MVSDRRSQGTPEWVHGAGHQSWEVAQMGRPETGLSSSFRYSLGVSEGRVAVYHCHCSMALPESG